jgi:cobalt-zinc-cadmium efflux system membrane fusion protein
MTLKRVAALLAVSILSTACNDHAAKEGPPQAKVEKGLAVVFPAGSPQLSSIHSLPAVGRKIAVSRFTGRLVWDEDRTVRVFSPLGGRVMSIAVRPGDAVKAGQVLAEVSAPELGQAQAEASRANQDFLLAQKNLARVEELHGAGVVAAKELQGVQAEVARASAERARTSARLRLYGANGSIDQRYAIRSPIAGVVVERNLNPGQELRPDSPPPPTSSAASGGGLFVVTDPAKLWFLLDVGEADIAAVTKGSEVQIRSTVLGEEKVTGRITHVADVVDPQTRAIKVRGTVENAERRLKAEMFVYAEFQQPSAKGVLIPAKAVYLRGERYFAFVEESPGRYVRRTVKLGPAFDATQIVTDGIAENEKVVTDGNLLLERLLAEKD